MNEYFEFKLVDFKREVTVKVDADANVFLGELVDRFSEFLQGVGYAEESIDRYIRRYGDEFSEAKTDSE